MANIICYYNSAFFAYFLVYLKTERQISNVFRCILLNTLLVFTFSSICCLVGSFDEYAKTRMTQWSRGQNSIETSISADKVVKVIWC